MRVSHLANLNNRLRSGLACLGGPFRETQAAFVLGSQGAEGGFAGRQGPPDLYYTGFGLRAMAVLAVAERTPWERAHAFLDPRQEAVADLADCLSVCESHLLLQRAGVRDASDPGPARAVRKAIALRRKDMGVYDMFLAASCLDLLGYRVWGARRGLARLLDHQQADGGFADRPGDVLSGTNPSAAAVVLVSRLKSADADGVRRGVRFLLGQQRDTGGFGAHDRAPGADLLSTFTAMAALDAVGMLRHARLGAVGRFVRELAGPDGGFRAMPEDDSADMEYTYYGLGSLGLLAAEVNAATAASGKDTA
jgi:geranylgeranyl transferase type-2 subunit beta